MTYEAAYQAMSAAGAKFTAVTEAYRARTIGDAEFLAARAEYEAIEAVYDAAYAEREALADAAEAAATQGAKDEADAVDMQLGFWRSR
jgi:hypothetical protein